VNFPPLLKIDFLSTFPHGAGTNSWLVHRLGGTWWQSRRDAFEKDIFGSDPETETFIRVGWTARGGAWVLYTTEANSWDDPKCEQHGGTLQGD
jgi:hypothetical protein